MDRHRQDPPRSRPAKGTGQITVPAGGSVIIGGEGNASAVLPNSREALKDGDAQPITFTFSETGEVSLRAFVVPAESYFAEWGPSEMPGDTGQPRPPEPRGTVRLPVRVRPSGCRRGKPS